MTRMVKCIKLGKEAPGMRFAPLPNELGKRIFETYRRKHGTHGRATKPCSSTKTAFHWPTRAPANIWRSKWRTIFSAKAQMPCKAMFRNK